MSNTKESAPIQENYIVSFTKKFELIGTVCPASFSPNSCMLQDLVMRWSWNWGHHNFLSFTFNINVCSVFSFIIFHIQENAAVQWQYDKAYKVISNPDCVLCQLSWEILLISFAWYAISVAVWCSNHFSSKQPLSFRKACMHNFSHR